MANEHILVVDDDHELRDSIKHLLENEGMKVATAEELNDTLSLLQKEPFDLVLLDLMLKTCDGFDILKQIRKVWVRLPVFILSCRQEEDKKAVSFELEADDYVIKPFSKPELVARIKRHIRKYKGEAAPADDSVGMLYAGDLKLNFKTCLLYKKNKELTLSQRLFRILKFFMENPAQVFSKEQIYNHCWDDGFYDDNTVKVYIRRLRKIIEDDPGRPEHLKTIIGFGYRFDI